MSKNGSKPWPTSDRFDLTRPFEAETRSRPLYILKEDGDGRVEIVPTTINPELKFAALQLNPARGDEENAQASTRESDAVANQVSRTTKENQTPSP